MQNMMRLTDSIGSLNVFFDVNPQTREIENLSVFDGMKKVDIMPDHMERAKDVIAAEYALSMIEMAVIVKSGMQPVLC